MLYFPECFERDKKRELIKERKVRSVLINKKGQKANFGRGDVLTINFWVKSCAYHFEGICLALKRKVGSPNFALVLRNVLYGTGVDVTALFFMNRLYRNLFVSDYKRKRFTYSRSKLYHLGIKDNQESRVKF